MGRIWRAPLDVSGRGAVDRVIQERPGIGPAFLFPHPRDLSRPVPYETVARWLRKAEELAGVEKQVGGLFHPYRRKWVSERPHIPDVVLAQAGGWKDVQCMRASYQQADDLAILVAVQSPKRLRSVS